MNWDRIQEHWKDASARARIHWDKLTDADLEAVAGRRGQLVGKIQERYGVAKNEAERQLGDWQRTASRAWFADDDDR